MATRLLTPSTAIVVASIPVLVLVWALFLLVFREAALLAINTISLIRVFDPWIILFNVSDS
jgi:hypothetical protein